MTQTKEAAASFIAAMEGTPVVDSRLAEKLLQLTEMKDLSAEQIEKSERTAFIDLSVFPPRAIISGFWKGRDLDLGIRALRRAYHINRSVLKAKGVGASQHTPDGEVIPAPRKKPLKGKAAIDARDAVIEEMKKEAILAALAQAERRGLAEAGVTPLPETLAPEETKEAPETPLVESQPNEEKT